MSGPDLKSIVGAGTSLLVGTTSHQGEPRATRAWGALVVGEAPLRLRVLMSADDDVAVANLTTGAVAVTGADVRTLRSVQVKGPVVAVEAPSVADLDAMSEHVESFLAAVVDVDGGSPSVLRRLLPHQVVAFEVVVDGAFDQSPGPTAGTNVPTPT